MDMARLLKNTANCVVGVSVVRMLAGDLAAELRHDTAVLRATANSQVRNFPYRAAGMAAGLGALTGMVLAHRRSPRTIPTRV
jgi:ElaB/YqjD/DUF883 family membrane-anchored ribosome-binding protein